MSRVPQRAIKCRRCYHGTRGVLLQALSMLGDRGKRGKFWEVLHNQTAKRHAGPELARLGIIYLFGVSADWVGLGRSCSFLLIFGQYWRKRFPPNFQPRSDV